jgi:hypothetical protein
MRFMIAVAFIILALAPRVGPQNSPINVIEVQNQKFNRADKAAKEAKSADLTAQQASVRRSKSTRYVPPTFVNYQEAFKIAEQRKQAADSEPTVKLEN